MTLNLGTETNSLTNHMMAGARQIEPKRGMGATILCWTDRHAATITHVTSKSITVAHDIVTRTDNNGISECQSYSYETDELCRRIEVFRLTKRGWRNTSGNGLLIGYREEYHDFSF